MELTTEDQLVADLITYWTATPPTGINDGEEEDALILPFIHFRTEGVLPVPAVIIGHEGFEREKMKGMDGTGRVNLRVALRTDLDVMDAEDHRVLAAALDRGIAALSGDDLPLTYLHAILREAPQYVVQDRRQITVLRYIAIATRCEEA